MKQCPIINKFRLLIILLVFTAKVRSQNPMNIVNKIVDFGMETAIDRKIDVVIIHSTYNASGGDFYDINLVLKQFKQYGVCSHYIIGRDGKIYLTVAEKNIAYHAGRGKLPDGRTSINTCSIGIELMTSTTEAPTERQIHSLTLLVKDIKRRYKITYILRHSDIAPDRKTDPWNMKWNDFLKELN